VNDYFNEHYFVK